MTAVSREGSQTKDLEELHYFISGAHWKHVDSSGETPVLYDPESHLVHNFKPQVKTVDASESAGPAKFEPLPDTRLVLGRTCKGVRWTTRVRTITGFYDPDLFVDPAPFINHHHGHWAETLRVTNGALILWSNMELPQGDIISEPVSIGRANSTLRSGQFQQRNPRMRKTNPDQVVETMHTVPARSRWRLRMHRAFAVAASCFACARPLPTKVVADDHRIPSVAPATTGTAPPDPTPGVGPAPVLDTSIDVGTVRLHLVCAGTGGPLVVFEAGLGLDGSAWRLVQPEVARVTRACAYDRAGRGLSGPAPNPHGQRQMAEELYGLLRESGQPGPYILVGHSMGGAIVRWFLDAHPSDVAGMVLVDAATEDWASKVLSRVPLEARSEFWSNLHAWEGLDSETYVAGYEGLRSRTTSLGSHPLVILTAGKPASDLPLRLEMQGTLKRLSTNVLHAIVENSGHNIPLEAPLSVVSSVQAVIRAARTHSRLSPITVHEHDG